LVLQVMVALAEAEAVPLLVNKVQELLAEAALA
jgi:hypothetical protein